MRYYITLLCLAGLFLSLINSSPAEPPVVKEPDKQVKSSPTDADAELKRLKEVLQDERDVATKLWILRRLATYPAHISGPILLEQLNKSMVKNTLVMRCAIVYCLGQIDYQPAIPQMVEALRLNLSKYGWTPPEVFKEELVELRRLSDVKKDEKDGKYSTPSPSLTPADRRERLATARQRLLENYEQKLNWGLLHLRIMKIVGKFKAKDATDELHKLIITNEIPISYMAIDTLKLIDDPKAIETLNKNSALYCEWEPYRRERVIYAMTELSCPYRKPEEYEGTEWLKKSLFKLIANEINRPGQSNICLIKALNIMDMLSKPICQIYDFSSENNLMKEFTDLTNLLKGNDPEIMLYDHDLLIKFIREEMLMKALYNTFDDVLKPSPVIIITPSSTPPSEPPTKTEPTPKTEPSAPADNKK
jgi:hypothetical protein